jgi:tRNA pseudouridine38-40 synthase
VTDAPEAAAADAVGGPDAEESATPWAATPLERAREHGVAPGLVRVRVDLAYDGTAFAGWAHQPGRRTVQGVLEEALGVLCRGPAPRVTVAGRTDAGVHARGQVCHVDLPEPVAHDERLLRRLNGLLPEDVRVRRTADAPDGFDARFSAVSRTYRYQVADGPEQVDPLRRHDTLAWPRRLDLAALQAACAPLLGVHDFAAYCRRREGATTVRGVLELGWRRDDVLVMTVTADAFCHSMVRSLVGAFLAVGEGRREPAWMASLLTLGARAQDVVVAPPHGLSLEAVGYPPDDQLLARQEVTRALRA